MALAVVNLALAAYMTGIGWAMHVVHYPLFAAVGRDGWAAYHDEHSRRITLIVAAPMIIALIVAIGLAVDRTEPLTVANATLAVGVFALTATWFGRLHRALQPFDDVAHGRLLAWNAFRVAAWTAQMSIAVLIAIGA